MLGPAGGASTVVSLAALALQHVMCVARPLKKLALESLTSLLWLPALQHCLVCQCRPLPSVPFHCNLTSMTWGNLCACDRPVFHLLMVCYLSRRDIDNDVARLVDEYDGPRATSAPPQFEDRWAQRVVGPPLTAHALLLPVSFIKVAHCDGTLRPLRLLLGLRSMSLLPLKPLLSKQ